MECIMKIVKYLEESGLLIKKCQWLHLLGNLLAGKGVIVASWEREQSK